MCMLGNIAVMEHDEILSLCRGPSHIVRKLLGCVVTSQKEVKSGAIWHLLLSSFHNPCLETSSGWSCTK